MNTYQKINDDLNALKILVLETYPEKEAIIKTIGRISSYAAALEGERDGFETMYAMLKQAAFKMI